jgi:hypothetical protein
MTDFYNVRTKPSNTLKRRLLKCLLASCGVIVVFITSCVSPPPQSFVDAAALPSDFAGREHRSFVRNERLIIEVSQIPGFNVVGFDAFEQAGALYISPRRISSGGTGTTQFEVDVAKYRLRADWPEHVYWLLEEYSYPIGHSGFWSSEKRSPWPRKKMEIMTQ